MGIKVEKKSDNIKTHSIARNFLSSSVNAFGSIVGGILPVFKKLFGGTFKIIAIILSAALGFAWVASVFGISWAAPILNVAGPKNGFVSYLGIFSGLLFIALPLLGLLLTVIRLAWSYRIPTQLKTGLWAAWFVSIFSGGTAGLKLLSESKTHFETTQNAEFNIIDPIIKISALPEMKHNVGVAFGGSPFFEVDNHYKYEDVHVYVEKSPDNLVHVLKHLEGRGANTQDAQLNTFATINEYISTGNEFVFDQLISLPKSQKYRQQDIHYTIQVPVGKKVVFDDNIKRLMRESELFTWDKLNSEKGTEWTISETGAISEAYEDQINHRRELNPESYSKIIIEDGFDVIIQKGSKNTILIEGEKEIVNKVVQKNLGGVISLIGGDREFENIKLIITVANNLELIQLNDVNSVNISGINQKDIKIISIAGDNFDQKISFSGILASIDLNLQGNQKFNIDGSSNTMTLNLSDDANIDADKFIVNEAKIIGGDMEQSIVHVSKTITCKDPEFLNIRTVGNPEIKKF
jgi:Putative auto-transporter adhesin, head GIN domain